MGIELGSTNGYPTEYEGNVVIDSAGAYWIEYRIYNIGTDTFSAPIYYKAGSSTPGTPSTPVEYVQGKQSVITGANYDNFNRERVGIPTPLVDIKLSAGFPTDLLSTYLNATGVIIQNPATDVVELSVTTTNDHVICQTFQRFLYRTGQAQEIYKTGSRFEPETNVIKRTGYYSAAFNDYTDDYLDGLFFESSNGDVSVNIWFFGTEIESTPSSSWNRCINLPDNVVNKITTSEISAIDWSKDQLVRISFGWLGVAGVIWEVYVHGVWKALHFSRHDNILQTAYMRFANQPLRWEIKSTGGAGQMNFICSNVISNGTIQSLGRSKGIDRGSNYQNANNKANTYANIGIALDETKPESFRNTVINMTTASVLGITSNDAFVWRLYKLAAGDISGTILSWNSLTNSAIKYFYGQDDNIITGGEVMATGYVSQRESSQPTIDSLIKPGVSLNGTPEIYVIGIQPISSNLDVLASINWHENN